MSCRINLVNKKTGVIYVYESISFRDKEKKLPRNKRICIGKLDPVSGELIQKIDDETLYVHSRLYPWGKENRRCYLHLCYKASARAKAVDQFNEELVAYKRELESG